MATAPALDWCRPIKAYWICDSDCQVPIWSSLQQLATGLEYSLQGLPPNLVAEIQAKNKHGRAAQERGDRETAEQSFLQCREMVAGEVKQRLKREDAYAFVLAWALLPLAQLYRSQGGADKLKRALDLRREVLELILASTRYSQSDSNLPAVCYVYYFTAHYELGEALGSSKEKLKAVQGYARVFLNRNEADAEADAEAQICYFLCVDHAYSGSFELVRHRWIHEASRLRKKQTQDMRRLPLQCEIEAILLMKLGKYSEAVALLKEYLAVNKPGSEVSTRDANIAQKFCKMLEACYMELSSKAALIGDSQHAKEYKDLEDLATEQRGMIQNILTDGFHVSERNSEGQYVRSTAELSFAHPMVDPVFSDHGILPLGLVQGDGLYFHCGKLPILISIVMLLGPIEIQENAVDYDWPTVIKSTYSYEERKELLKLTKKLIDKDTYNWILSYFDLPLANLYHYQWRKADKAAEIWKEIHDCFDEASLQKGYHVPLAALEYECANTSEEKLKIIQKWAKAYGTDEIGAERDICFWLYFGYHCHGNYEWALKWLREAKRLWEEHSKLLLYGGCPGKRCFGVDYFSCNCDVLRCEAELLIKLGRMEASIPLKTLLKTTHVQQESYMRIFPNCILILDNDEENARVQESTSKRSNVKYNAMKVKAERGVNVQEGSVSPNCGCIIYEGVLETKMLIPSPSVMENQLYNLPVPIQLALQKHGELGRSYNEESADWKSAIFHYKWCREILYTLGLPGTQVKSEFKAAYDWLMVWTTLPLANLYECWMKQYKLALELWIELLNWHMPNQYQREKWFMTHNQFHTMYLCQISEFPNDSDLKKKMLSLIVENFRSNLKPPEGLIDQWVGEILVTRTLIAKHITYENYEGALEYIQQAKRLMAEMPATYEDKTKPVYYEFVLVEENCLSELQMPVNNRKKILIDYWASLGNGVKREDLPTVVQSKLLQLEKADTRRSQFRTWRIGKLPTWESSPLRELRLKSLEHDKKQEYAAAIICHETCLRRKLEDPVIAKLENKLDKRYGFGFEDYCSLARLHHLLFIKTIKSTAHPVQDFYNEENFLKAGHYYQKCIDSLSSKASSPNKFQYLAVANYCLVMLYAEIEHQYGETLLFKWAKVPEINANDAAAKEVTINLSDEIMTWISKMVKDYPLQKYAERTIKIYVRFLHALQNRQHVEGWIEWLEHHKILYTLLQSHHYRRSIASGNLTSNNPGHEDLGFLKDEKEISLWNSFLYAEGERTRVMSYELETTWKLKPWGLNALDTRTMKDIQNTCAALLEDDVVYVNYSRASVTDPQQFLIYVIERNQDGCKLIAWPAKSLRDDHGITRSTLKERPSAEKRLDDFYGYIGYKQAHPEHKEVCCLKSNCKRYSKHKSLRRRHSTIYDDQSLKEYLEFLHGALIKPVESHLRRGAKLIFSPSELLTKVPFAALRDPDLDEKNYLIERHTIALAPSFRILDFCSERLKELQKPSFTSHEGSIVALGEPAYRCCSICNSERTLLSGTGDEVESIATLFGKTTPVVKLLREKATKGNLLEWAVKSSHDSFRQAIVHVGAHATVDVKNHMNNVLQLACDKFASHATDGVSSGHVEASIARGPSEHTEDVASDSEGDDVWTHLENDMTFTFDRCGSLVVNSIDSFEVPMDDVITTTSSSSSSAIIERSSERSSMQDGPSHDLEVRDINSSKTKWKTELLVLSACQTLSGRITAEGVLSLARAFMAIGVPCIVASLWKVDDKATLALMTAFYEELWKGCEVACALRSAMLRSMVTYGPDAVHYWAPFYVLGESSLRIPQELQEND